MPAKSKENNLNDNRTLKTLLEWEAPSRIFKPRSKEFFSTVLTIGALFVVILVFLKEWFLILTIISLIFLVFVFNKVPPQTVKHKITNRGIVSGETQYPWEDFIRFWIEEKDGQKILYLDRIRPPYRLMMLINSSDEIKKILLDYLPEEKPQPTFLEKASKWLTEKFPLE